MAKTMTESSVSAGQNNSESTIFQADGTDRIELPSSDFIANAALSRDGDNLILQTANGETVVIEGYFAAEPAPVLLSPDGAALTPALVQSFVTSPLQYAANETANDESPVGAIEEVQGNATVTRADGTVETIKIGTPIYEGDIIETDAQGAVNIVFLDQTSMAISENARMAVDDYTFNPETESGTTNFSVLRGLFVFTSGLIGRDDPDNVKIETPVGSIGIRGTIIAGEIAPGGESKISVLEGAIVITNGLGSVTLSEQFETVKLGSYESAMENIGVVPANDIGTRFNSVGTVLPTLFTTINDSAAEQRTFGPQSQAEPATQETQPSQPAIQNAAPVETVQPAADVVSSGLPTLQTALGQPPSTNLSEATGDNSFNMPAAPSSTLISGAQTPLTSAPSENTQTQTQPAVSAAPPVETPPLLPVTPTTPVIPAPAVSMHIDLNQSAAGVSVISDNINNGAGYSISALGDIDGDGFDDFVFSNVNASGSTNQNHAYIFYGDSTRFDSATIPRLVNEGTIDIRALPNVAGNISYTEVAGIGDFNGDGVVDFLSSQSGSNSGSYVSSGNAFVINGANNSNQIFSGPTATYQLGVETSGVGDFDNDGYADVVLSSAGSSAHFIHGAATTPAMTALTNAYGSENGQSVAGIGDFNGDGYDDFAVGVSSASGGNGALYIYAGNRDGLTGGPTILNGGAGEGLGREVISLGDINGDGRSDLAALGSAENIARIHLGGNAGEFSVDVPGTYTIIGGSGVGDFNGDGYADFALSLGDANTSRTFVVLGKESFPTTIDMNYLTNNANAFELSYSGMNEDSEPDISAIGDANGDGFDDFAIGVPDINGNAAGDGGIFLVYGRTSGNLTSGTTATADDQHLLATNAARNLNDGGFENVSLQGNGATNVFTLSNTNFLGVHGGGSTSGGLDTIFANSNLDFSNIDSEKISGIEQLRFGGAGQTMTLTVENIFNLLKTSDTGDLRITSDMAGSTLNLDADTATGSGTAANIVGALGEMSDNVTSQGTSGGYNHFKIGGYDLYIDTDVAVNVA